MNANYINGKTAAVFVMLLLIIISSVATAGEVVTLEEVLELGLKKNVGLIETEIDRNKAEVDLNSAKKAFYPEVSVSTSYTRVFIEGDDTISTGFPALDELISSMQPNEDNYSTSISLQQPIYAGGKLKSRLELAEKGIDVAEVEVKQKKNDLLFQIIQSYYNVLLAQERIEIEKDALALVREHKRTARVGYNAGTVLKTDVLQVEIEEGKAVHSLEVARNDLLMAKKMLGNTVGAELEDKVMVWPGLSPDLKLDRGVQIQIAKMNRPELELINFNKKMLKINLQMEKNSHLPNIVLSANHQWQSQEFSLEDGTSSVTLSVNMNIFDKDISNNKQKNLEKDLKKLNLNKSNLEKLIMLEIEDILLTIQENQNDLKLQRLNLQKAEENLELENKKYKVGMGTNVNVMDAQVTLKQTRIAEMQAEYQYKINLFKLLQKTGQLIDYYNRG